MKNNNKIIFWLTAIGIILIIGLPTILTVMHHHYDKKMNVMESKIKESAEDCWNEEKCKDNEITLKELIEKNYLQKEDTINPKTKEYLKEDTKIIRKEKEIIIDIKK